MAAEYISHVRDLAEKKKITWDDFKLKFQLRTSNSEDTAKRIWNGETGTSAINLLEVAEILGFPADKVFEKIKTK